MDPMKEAEDLMRQADAHQHSGRTDDAIPLLVAARDVLCAAFGEKHTASLSCTKELANIYLTLGHTAQAQPLLEFLLSVRDETSNENSKGTWTVVHQLGLLHLQVKQYNAALKMLRRSKNISDHVFENNDPNIGISHSCYARVVLIICKHKGSRDEAPAALSSIAHSIELAQANPNHALGHQLVKLYHLQADLYDIIGDQESELIAVNNCLQHLPSSDDQRRTSLTIRQRSLQDALQSPQQQTRVTVRRIRSGSNSSVASSIDLDDMLPSPRVSGVFDFDSDGHEDMSAPLLSTSPTWPTRTKELSPKPQAARAQLRSPLPLAQVTASSTSAAAAAAASSSTPLAGPTPSTITSTSTSTSSSSSSGGSGGSAASRGDFPPSGRSSPSTASVASAAAASTPLPISPTRKTVEPMPVRPQKADVPMDRDLRRYSLLNRTNGALSDDTDARDKIIQLERRIALLEGDPSVISACPTEELENALRIHHDAVAGIEAALKERKDAEKSGICRVCLDRKISVFFQPCGHACLCEVCSDGILTCPFCRATIEQRLKVYIP